jgi:hypothetical protein
MKMSTQHLSEAENKSGSALCLRLNATSGEKAAPTMTFLFPSALRLRSSFVSASSLEIMAIHEEKKEKHQNFLSLVNFFCFSHSSPTRFYLFTAFLVSFIACNSNSDFDFE